MKGHRHFVVLLFVGLCLLAGQRPALAQTPAVVHAVLFYSPTCPHCQEVITQVLPPLFDQYHDQLQIIGIDVTQPGGQALYLNALQYFHLDTSGVPFLVVGDTYLVGSLDIPEQFPGLIEKYLAQGGLDWPPIPGLADVLPTPSPTSTAITPVVTPTPGLFVSGSLANRLGSNFSNDPWGNSLAVVVLAVMIVSVARAIQLLRRAPGARRSHLSGWTIPILCAIGLGIAGYLAYSETTQAQAVCGPVGDCNSVQQSAYARLFGVLPIGILGKAGYGLILLTWAARRFAKGELAAYADLAQLGMSAFGILFSIYLTFLEPFVIGATCAWCLTSAILMTALLWLSLAPGRIAIKSLFSGEIYA